MVKAAQVMCCLICGVVACGCADAKKVLTTHIPPTEFVSGKRTAIELVLHLEGQWRGKRPEHVSEVRLFYRFGEGTPETPVEMSLVTEQGADLHFSTELEIPENPEGGILSYHFEYKVDGEPKWVPGVLQAPIVDSADSDTPESEI